MVCDSSFRPHDASWNLGDAPLDGLRHRWRARAAVRHTRGSATPCRLRRGSRGDARLPLPRWLHFFAREACWSARAMSSARAWSGCVSLPEPPGPQSSRAPLRVVFLAHWRDGVMGARPASRRAARGSRPARLAKSDVTPSTYHPRCSRARPSAAAAPMRARFSRHLGFIFHRANSLGRIVPRASSLLTRPSDPRPPPARLTGWPAAPL